ncbi:MULTISPECIES: hypothetical protein [Pseudomonas syringae group]|uniref:DUF3077 domain-containing protein n=1 Tax=Pseudomonas caspiana TaxID=1451454 RepID=A0A1Y3P5M4_9PSED|nr:MULTISPECIES: hypothetical protein [Pseudomonas syringae group]MDU8357259.1 hypothetical protein [Pseudomonas syringae group sp. J309-1]OUM75146.1 hypothetical protein AUC60_02790 [Pseudomonas caspiana]
MKQTLSHSTPEDIFSLTDVEAGVPIDAITCAISRADAVLLLLEDQFEDERPSLSNHVIASALWDVRGTLGLIHKLAMHADRTSAPVAHVEAGS